MEAPEVLQKKLYFLLEQLQNMARDLPPWVTNLILAQLFKNLFIFLENIK